MSASYLLAVAFPPSKGFNGASTTIADLSRHGLAGNHLSITPSKRSAARLIFEANMERATAYGHGNRAARRLLAA